MDSSEKIYLGIDWGEKRIGLAMADSVTKIATPLMTVSSLLELLAVINDDSPDILVLGKPLKMRDSDDSMSKSYLDFLNKLKNAINHIPIELVDERLTSKAGDALIGDKKTKAGRDEIAAMIILQNYLDSI